MSCFLSWLQNRFPPSEQLPKKIVEPPVVNAKEDVTQCRIVFHTKGQKTSLKMDVKSRKTLQELLATESPDKPALQYSIHSITDKDEFGKGDVQIKDLIHHGKPKLLSPAVEEIFNYEKKLNNLCRQKEEEENMEIQGLPEPEKQRELEDELMKQVYKNQFRKQFAKRKAAVEAIDEGAEQQQNEDEATSETFLKTPVKFPDENTRLWKEIQNREIERKGFDSAFGRISFDDYASRNDLLTERNRNSTKLGEINTSFGRISFREYGLQRRFNEYRDSSLELDEQKATVLSEQMSKVKYGIEKLYGVLTNRNYIEKYKKDIDFLIANVAPHIEKWEKEKKIQPKMQVASKEDA